jgi:hypothetical protein
VGYAVLCNALSTYDRSALYNETYVDAAVDRLNVAVTHATNIAVRSGYIKKLSCMVVYKTKSLH